MQRVWKMKINRIFDISTDDLNTCFEIIKHNMQQLGFKISEQDKIVWQQSVFKMLTNENVYFYLLKKDNILGFVEFVNNNGNLTLCEIQLSPQTKQTFVLLDALLYFEACEEFMKFDKVEFSILKNNSMSNKTFTHLGGKLTSQTEKKNLYILTRKQLEEYLNKFKPRRNNKSK